jgi:hypothetical protein
MTNPVGGMYMAAHESAMGRRNEAAVFIGEAQKRDERIFLPIITMRFKTKN